MILIGLQQLIRHTHFRMGANRIVGKRILLVDDDPDARQALRLLLSIDGHTVTEANNGREACLLYSPGEFDVVFTDYEMPEMKGDELAATIKCLVPSQRIIMITGVPWKLAGEKNPVDAVLIKPVTLDELRQYITAVLSREPGTLPLSWAASKSGKSIGLGLT